MVHQLAVAGEPFTSFDGPRQQPLEPLTRALDQRLQRPGGLHGSLPESLEGERLRVVDPVPDDPLAIEHQAERDQGRPLYRVAEPHTDLQRAFAEFVVVNREGVRGIARPALGDRTCAQAGQEGVVRLATGVVDDGVVIVLKPQFVSACGRFGTHTPSHAPSPSKEGVGTR